MICSRRLVFRQYILSYSHGVILDSGLTYLRDVIDTEPSYGDVYKMLLGSFVENYDGDENRLELVESPQGTQGTESLYSSYSSHTSSSHASPSLDGPYALPTRSATEMSQQTIRPSGHSQNQSWPPPETSARSHRGGYL